MNLSMYELTHALKAYYHNADKTEKIILDCAMVATGADFIGGAIPGLAIPAAIISCFGAVWAMYGMLCDALEIQLKKNVLKLLAKAALANICANLAGALIALVVAMMIPGASAFASALVTFVTIYLAGLIFLQLILKLAKTSQDLHSFSDVSQKDMEKVIHETKVGEEDLAAAKAAFEQSKTEQA